jgi:hypothetical protein
MSGLLKKGRWYIEQLQKIYYGKNLTKSQSRTPFPTNAAECCCLFAYALSNGLEYTPKVVVHSCNDKKHPYQPLLCTASAEAAVFSRSSTLEKPRWLVLLFLPTTRLPPSALAALMVLLGASLSAFSSSSTIGVGDRKLVLRSADGALGGWSSDDDVDRAFAVLAENKGCASELCARGMFLGEEVGVET